MQRDDGGHEFTEIRLDGALPHALAQNRDGVRKIVPETIAQRGDDQFVATLEVAIDRALCEAATPRNALRRHRGESAFGNQGFGRANELFTGRGLTRGASGQGEFLRLTVACAHPDDVRSRNTYPSVERP